MNLAVLVFFVATLGCFYVYVGYPALLLCLSRWRSRPVRQAPIHPDISLILPVHDEEPIIEAKIENCLALGYPDAHLEILIVSDGSTDRTEEIARRYVNERVRLISLPRQGKAKAIEEGVRRARGEIVAFSDANVLLEPDSLRRLVRVFADEEVGGVFGSYLVNPGSDATSRGQSFYWRFDQWQKRLESGIGSAVGASGALYAIRRSLYRPFREVAQADDFAISVGVVLQGKRLIYEPGAIAYENMPRESRQELRRKIRIVNHSLWSLFGLSDALWRSGFYSVQLISHKLLRYLVPVFLLALYLSSLHLAPTFPGFADVLVFELVVSSFALVGMLSPDTRLGRSRLFWIPYYFYMVNAAALFGLVSVMRGIRIVAWTPRGGAASDTGG